MKKLITICGLYLLAINTSLGQCIPGTDFNGNGLTLAPLQLEAVFTCTGCGSHVREVSVQTFTDTTLSVEIQPGNPPLDVTVYADFFRLDSIGGLPDGLTYTTDAAFDTTFDEVENPFGYWINAGDTTVGFTNTTGCISIEGDEAAWNDAVGGGPNNDGVYPLTFFIDARAANFYPAAIGGIVGFNTWLTDMGVLLDAFGDPNFTVNGIKLVGPDLVVVQSGVGVDEQESQFTNLTAIPNPTEGITSLTFENASTGIGHVQLYSMDGRIVHDKTVNLINGMNRVVFDFGKLDSGLYNLQLTSQGGISATRLVIK